MKEKENILNNNWILILKKGWLFSSFYLGQIGFSACDGGVLGVWFYGGKQRLHKLFYVERLELSYSKLKLECITIFN